MAYKFGNITFHQMYESDAKRAAQLHIESIEKGFISSLGIEFVSALYKAIIGTKAGFGIVAKEENKIVGFVAFATDLSSLYKSVVLNNFFRLSLPIIGKLLSWHTLKKLGETLLYPRRTKKRKLPSAELLSIVVSADARSNGLGTRLVRMGLAECLRLGIENVKVMVGCGNETANRVYSKCGFKLVGKIDNHGIKNNIYVADTNQV